jgi:flagellar hook-basal body complex protein FliE
MAINPADAIKAFNQASRLGGAGMEPRGGKAAGSFAELVGELAGDLAESGKKAETMSAKAAAGEAELLDVVTAVSNAELTLQAVVAVRDRVISAYQDILRMPI